MPSIDGLIPIGVVRTRFDDPRETPIQPSLNADDHGVLEVEPEYADALDGVEAFSHLWLVTWLRSSGSRPDEARVDLRQSPYLMGATSRKLGIFATRGPRRPNRIGLHLVRLVSVSESPPTIVFAGVDLVDGTLVLDVKPWVDRFDTPFGSAPVCGWFDGVVIEDDATPASLARRRDEDVADVERDAGVERAE